MCAGKKQNDVSESTMSRGGAREGVMPLAQNASREFPIWDGRKRIENHQFLARIGARQLQLRHQRPIPAGADGTRTNG